jgi:hypothetical protein
MFKIFTIVVLTSLWTGVAGTGDVTLSRPVDLGQTWRT